MNLQIQARMAYGDESALADFFLVHRLVHLADDAAITAKFGTSLPNQTLDSDSAMKQWSALMRIGLGDKQEVPSIEALNDWLRFHNNLHNMEYSLLGLGVAPGLDQVRFDKPAQFYDWMYIHSAVHEAQSLATGVV